MFRSLKNFDDDEQRIFGRRHKTWSRFSDAMKVIGVIFLGLTLTGLLVLMMWMKIQAYGGDVNCLFAHCVIVK